jgi:hypothetical protein
MMVTGGIRVLSYPRFRLGVECGICVISILTIMLLLNVLFFLASFPGHLKVLYLPLWEMELVVIIEVSTLEIW